MKRLQCNAQSFLAPAGLSIVDIAFIKQRNIFLYTNVYEAKAKSL